MKRLALFMVLMLPVSGSLGCSWIFVEPLPASYERGDPPQCTANPVAPVVDTLFTLTNVGSAVYVAGEDNVANKGAAVTVGLLVGALWLSSAIYGYSKVSACDEAKNDFGEAPRHSHLRPPPAVGYPGGPSPRAAPSIEESPGWTPAARPAQQQDEDEEPVHPERARKKAPPPPAEKIDAPRFGG